MDDNKFLIHIEIADKTYGLRINRDQEELARKAAKQLKAALGEYRKKYPKSTKDDPKYAEGNTDWLAMVALQLSMENLQWKERNDTTPFIEKIKQMTGMLEEYMKDNE
ncbi:MAG: cell division protein ZapA [Tannerellaceae bacterium]|jgi:cell division protein ZapA|nr:cell division protein ZapA [Tannerellaceae bacterium]